MTTVHNIAADFYETTLKLIAIHSPLEDYVLAYALNYSCGLHLKRMEHDLHVNTKLSFPAFEWENPLNDTRWMLIANKSSVEEKTPESNLFAGQVSLSTHYFMKEWKDVDYILKVETEDALVLSSQIKAIRTLSSISIAYPIAPKTATSKKNVIL